MTDDSTERTYPSTEESLGFALADLHAKVDALIAFPNQERINALGNALSAVFALHDMVSAEHTKTAEHEAYWKQEADRRQLRIDNRRNQMQKMLDYIVPWLKDTYEDEQEASDAGVCSGFRDFLTELCDDYGLNYPWHPDYSDALSYVDTLRSDLRSVQDSIDNAISGLDEAESMMERGESAGDVRNEVENADYEIDEARTSLNELGCGSILEAIDG